MKSERDENAEEIAIEIANTDDLIDELIGQARVTGDKRFHKFTDLHLDHTQEKISQYFLNEYASNQGRKDLGQLVAQFFGIQEEAGMKRINMVLTGNVGHEP